MKFATLFALVLSFVLTSCAKEAPVPVPHPEAEKQIGKPVSTVEPSKGLTIEEMLLQVNDMQRQIAGKPKFEPSELLQSLDHPLRIEKDDVVMTRQRLAARKAAEIFERHDLFDWQLVVGMRQKPDPDGKPMKMTLVVNSPKYIFEVVLEDEIHASGYVTDKTSSPDMNGSLPKEKIQQGGWTGALETFDASNQEASIVAWGLVRRISGFTPTPSITLSSVELAGSPLPRGPEEAVALQVKLELSGESSSFSMPPVVFRKSGGAPWKTLADVRQNISDVRVISRDGKFIVDPVFEVVGDEQFTLLDQDTVICRMKSGPWFVFEGDTQLLTVMVKIGGNAYITTISAALEPGRDNIAGVLSGKKTSSGGVAGPTLVIRSQ